MYCIYGICSECREKKNGVDGAKGQEMASSARVKVVLACTECGDRNYTTTKNKKPHPERMEVRKYCPRLRRYTIHKETK